LSKLTTLIAVRFKPIVGNKVEHLLVSQDTGGMRCEGGIAVGCSSSPFSERNISKLDIAIDIAVRYRCIQHNERRPSRRVKDHGKQL
jgi:hypothetical protein